VHQYVPTRLTRPHFQRRKQDQKGSVMVVMRRDMKLHHVLTRRMIFANHLTRGKPATSKSKNQDDKKRTHLVMASNTFATLAGERDVLVRIVSWVKFLSPTLPMIILCLERLKWNLCF
jgi:hypothetical protein